MISEMDVYDVYHLDGRGRLNNWVGMFVALRSYVEILTIPSWLAVKPVHPDDTEFWFDSIGLYAKVQLHSLESRGG